MEKEYGKEAIKKYAITIKDNTKMTKNQDMEYINGLQEIIIKVIFLMIWDMDKERCIGMMEVIIKEVGN